MLFAEKGLLVMSPVLALAAVGVFLIHRAGRRAEALTIAGVALAVFLYNAGFYLDRGDPRAPVHPFGGASPGPRLLLPALPFLAVGLAAAYRRLPLATVLTALVSAGWMLAATLTQPLVYQRTEVWWDRLVDADFTATVFTEVGLGNGWLAIAPVLAAVAAAIVVAARLTPTPVRAPGDMAVAAGVLGLSVSAALVGHRVLDHEGPFGPEYGRLAAIVLALVAVGLAGASARRHTAPG